MSQADDLTRPWLVAVWPGMGSVALAAGSFLIDKLDLQPLLALHVDGHFDLQQVDIRGGLVVPPRRPRSQFYAWKNPAPEGRDLVVFMGEAQPQYHAYDYCSKVLQVARGFGVERVITFASLVTPRAPGGPGATFGIATQSELLREFREQVGDMPTLEEGRIAGLNGSFLAAALERGLEGACFLGEVPQIAAQLPYLRATHGVLTAFCAWAGVEIDLGELGNKAEELDQHLVEVARRLTLRMKVEQEGESKEPEATSFEPSGEQPTTLSAAALAEIESLFLEAQRDRAAAYRLKETLDSHEVFDDYEDRFLDLFQ